jgi:hypothetical protein
MSNKKNIAELEVRVDRFYEKHSATRVAVAAMIVGVASICSALGTYLFTLSAFITTAVFAGSSILIINIVMLLIIPPTAQLKASKAFILGALKDPLRIKAVERKKVILADGEGKTRALNAFEQSLWESIILPYFMQTSARAGVKLKRPLLSMSIPAMSVLEKEKAEMAKREIEIKAARQELERERYELEARTVALKQAEDLVIDRLSSVEVVEAELEQLQEDVERRVALASTEQGAAVEPTLQAKEVKLGEKAAELERLKAGLTEDRNIVEGQKTELNRLKGELLRDQQMFPLSKTERELELEQRERDLDDRFNYVSSVENLLIDRLNQLCEREATAEQSEINASQRVD